MEGCWLIAKMAAAEEGECDDDQKHNDKNPENDKDLNIKRRKKARLIARAHRDEKSHRISTRTKAIDNLSCCTSNY